MTTPPALEIVDLVHRYGERIALDRLTLSVRSGEFLAVLGPNGGGKTTLFRLLSTLIRPQAGTLRIFGHDPIRETELVRRELGVVFQAPSLDKKLSVAENLACHGRLYGLTHSEIHTRSVELLDRMGIADRCGDRVETLSGGLKRRVEICKALLHAPRLLLLDEPSTGLDPLARHELWSYLHGLREREGTTIVATTHFLDEAERADRTAILHEGKLVAYDSPDALRATLAGETLTLKTRDPDQLLRGLESELSIHGTRLDDAVRIESSDAHRLIARIVDAYPDLVDGVTMGRPNLEDVFIAKTGSRFHAVETIAVPKKGRR